MYYWMIGLMARGDYSKVYNARITNVINMRNITSINCHIENDLQPWASIGEDGETCPLHFLEWGRDSILTVPHFLMANK